ncbi:MAG: hypothetical protein ABJL67_04865 [Sulfitobacter sp.]
MTFGSKAKRGGIEGYRNAKEILLGILRLTQVHDRLGHWSDKGAG